MLQIALANGRRYTHAILNPPYKKLNSDSVHRALIRKVGIETVNLYTAFVALSALLMRTERADRSHRPKVVLQRPLLPAIPAIDL